MKAATSYKRLNPMIPSILSANSPFIVDEAAYRKKMERLEKLKKLAEQAAHDIMTPLQTLSMALDHRFQNLSKEEHTLLSVLTNGIREIAEAFLDHVKDGVRENYEFADRRHILVSQALTEIIEHTELTYCGQNAEFEYSFDPSLRFSFIYGKPLNFERMMRNLIKNSVEALEGKSGIVKVGFSLEDDDVKITVEDNGKGMPREILEKLMRGESASSSKVGGHGIGTSQIQDALEEFGGSRLIESALGVGSKITLIIPRSMMNGTFS